MDNKIIEIEKPIFQSIKEAVKTTGLSEYFFKQNIKAGTIPHIRSGRKIYINVSRLLAELDEQTSTRPVKL